MPTNIVEVECPFCRRRVSVQIFPRAAELAAAGDLSEVYERCPKCHRTFALLIPTAVTESTSLRNIAHPAVGPASVSAVPAPGQRI